MGLGVSWEPALLVWKVGRLGEALRCVSLVPGGVTSLKGVRILGERWPLALIFFTWRVLQDRMQERPVHGREEMPLSLEFLLKLGNRRVKKMAFFGKAFP